MKRVYVNEEWCLGCHLCEYNCAFADSGLSDMTLALKGKPIYPRIHIEKEDKMIGCDERAGIYTSMIREKTPLSSVYFDLLKNAAATAAFPSDVRRKKFGGAV